MAGFFAVGVENCKTEYNIGTLWRTADILGASFLFTIGRRYKNQSSDVLKSWRRIPLFNFESIEDLHAHLPYDCTLIGVELDDRAQMLSAFSHPKRAVYLLGSEDNGLKEATIQRCHHLVKLPGTYSMNVATVGSIVAYDRVTKLDQIHTELSKVRVNK
jgi:tRNA G18 (ribose-2'-O)-methylase SpoU